MVRILGTIAATLAALNAFMLAAPGDVVSTEVMLIIGAANASAAAAAAFLAKPT